MEEFSEVLIDVQKEYKRSNKLKGKHTRNKNKDYNKVKN